MNIEEIMKPYFAKKEEISKRPENYKYEQDDTLSKYSDENEKYRLENDGYEKEILALKTRLQTLRNNRNAEIEEYVKNAVSERPDFYAGYGAMIRKDLEQAYLKRDKALELQIISLSDKINNNYLKIAENNKLIRSLNDTKLSMESIHRIDVRELIDIKHDLRKVLISAKKELEIRLQEVQLNFDSVMYKLTTFKHEYNENHIVVNGDEYRKLFEESNRLIEVKYDLQRQLKEIEDSLKITELTEEEINVIMRSMTDLEKKEYDRRKMVSSIASTVEEIISEENSISKEESETKNTEQDSVEQLESENIEQNSVEELEAKNEEQISTEEQQKYFNFIKGVSKEILSSVKRLRTIRLENGKYLSARNPGKGKSKEEEVENYEIIGNSSDEQVELINGLYLNRKDVSKAFSNYVRKNKGRTFAVESVNSELTVNRKSLKWAKEALKKCSIIKLLSEKKLSTFDIKRVLGKDKAQEYTEEVESTKKTKMPTGDYVLFDDVCNVINEMFVEKTPTWIDNLKSKFSKGKEEIASDVVDADYEQIDSNEEEQDIVKVK